MAVSDGKPRDSAIHLRGDPHDRGETVLRGFLTGIGADWSGKLNGSGSGRSRVGELAYFAPGNPLTARVIANRVWHWHFGEGLVDNARQFRQNRRSSFQFEQLLDHLAFGIDSRKLVDQIVAPQPSSFRAPTAWAPGSESRLSAAPAGRGGISRHDTARVRGSLDLARPDGSSLYIIAEEAESRDLGAQSSRLRSAKLSQRLPSGGPQQHLRFVFVAGFSKRFHPSRAPG